MIKCLLHDKEKAKGENPLGDIITQFSHKIDEKSPAKEKERTQRVRSEESFRLAGAL